MDVNNFTAPTSEADVPASKDAYGRLLEIVTEYVPSYSSLIEEDYLLSYSDSDTVAPDVVESKAWDTIIAQWAQGWTHELVKALLVSNIDLHAFLAQLLRRIWVTMCVPFQSQISYVC